MERIKQAIEKAKSQTGAPPAYRPQHGHTTSRPSPAAPHSVEIGDVAYSQTRVVQLDSQHLENNRVIAYNKNGSMSWVFDLLRTQVLQKMEENGWRTLAVTSPTPGSGKTVVAINLAMSIAHHTTKTAMLVDFDLRRPKMAEYLGLPKGEKSTNDLLAGTAGLQEVLVNPGIPRLVVLPTCRPVDNSAEMLASPVVSNLITDLRERYDSRIVIFDLPPLLGTDDTISILPKIDCVLMVVGNGMSTKQDIEESMRHLSGANLLGTVLNKAEMNQHEYKY